MRTETLLVTTGKDPERFEGMVNPPIYQSSTILFPTIEAYHAAGHGKDYYTKPTGTFSDPSYGITGTPTSFALAEGLSALEGGGQTFLYPSGLSAITSTLLSFVKTGDHILVVDSAYGPTRRFCNYELKRLGIETTYYDPCIGEDISRLVKSNTSLVLTESPGSLTFEIQDIPLISRCIKSVQPHCVVAMDNSWATPLYYKAFDHGVDVVIHALTKYVGGHSDLILGSVTAKHPYSERLFHHYRHAGLCIAPHDAYTALRGLRTLAARMKSHDQAAREIASWLSTRPEVSLVLHPALPCHPGHELWKRDFTGSSGLFTFILHEQEKAKIYRFINTLKFFGIGSSWGGYESLIIDFDPTPIRTASPWGYKGTCIRLHIGLESPDDLIEDLSQAMKIAL